MWTGESAASSFCKFDLRVHCKHRLRVLVYFIFVLSSCRNFVRLIYM